MVYCQGDRGFAENNFAAADVKSNGKNALSLFHHTTLFSGYDVVDKGR